MYPNFVNGGLTLTIVHRVLAGTDESNNDVYTTVNKEVSGCAIQPASSREGLAFADQLTSNVVIFVPFGTDVTYIDAVIYNGVQYEVTGVPDTWTSPFSGNTAPIRIDGTMIEGAA
jgi:SPP1 family predicted phage head-tail adaptor